MTTEIQMRHFQETASAMQAIPKITISRELETLKEYDPYRIHTFRYRAKRHRELPHVVKFSGGRSSGMLLFAMLENGFLRQERGDVVVFNNTSCEHPETYRFVAECKKRVEAAGVPFFFVEFQTYEDARQGEWRRLPSYRLVNELPFSEDNPGGFRWRGEVFEGDAFAQGVPAKPIQPCLHAISQIGNNPAVPSRLVRKQEEHPIPRAWSRRIAGGRRRITQAPRLQRRRRSQRSPPSQEGLRTQSAHWPAETDLPGLLSSCRHFR